MSRLISTFSTTRQRHQQLGTLAASLTIAIFSVGCNSVTPCWETEAGCPPPPPPKDAITIAPTLAPNGELNPYPAGTTTSIGTGIYTEDQRDVVFTLVDAKPKSNCSTQGGSRDVWDGTPIELLDDTYLRLGAITESSLLTSYYPDKFTYYLQNPTYPPASYKDTWLYAEAEIEKLIICNSGEATSGPDADGQCGYPQIPPYVVGAANYEFWAFLRSPRQWVAACPEGGSAELLYVFSDTIDGQNWTINDVAITFNYNACIINGYTFNGTVEGHIKSTDPIALGLNPYREFAMLSDVTITDGAYTAHYTADTDRWYNNFRYSARMGDAALSCDAPGCPAGNVTWSTRPRPFGFRVDVEKKYTFFINDPRVNANGCVTTNVMNDID